MTFLTSFKVSHIIYSYMTRVHQYYLVKTSHFHISFIYVSSKRHKSSNTRHNVLYFITYSISIFESLRNYPYNFYVMLYISIKSSI